MEQVYEALRTACLACVSTHSEHVKPDVFHIKGS